jgi:hypothetical protein
MDNTKNIQREKKVEDQHKQFKQPTIDSLAYQFDIQKSINKEKPKKTIVITGIAHIPKEDELGIKIWFDLLPSKASFSKIILDVYFQDHLLNSATLGIPQSLLLNDSFEHSLVLDMKGIREGDYIIRVEIYELWYANEKLNFTSEERIIHYVPISREERLVKIPTVKSVADFDLAVVSSAAKGIFGELNDDLRRETESKRDQW